MNRMRMADLIDILQLEIQKEEKIKDSESFADLSSVSKKKVSITLLGGYDSPELVINKDDPCTFLIPW